MSDIYFERNNLLDSLNFDSAHTPTIPSDTENDLNLWTNAQFTYDIKPAYTKTGSNTSSPPNDNVTYGGLPNYLSSYPPIYPKDLNKTHPPLFPKLSLDELANVLSAPIPAVNSINKPNLANKEKQSVDDDKRKRNTAASARFRIKKKMKEQDKERTVREMTEKSERLEKKVCDLEQEIKWLRKLLIDKESNSIN
ncbi:unnamed protein product [Rhizopus stolonifer]